MANFKQVNKAITQHVSENHPHIDISVEAVRGEGYVYFLGPQEIPSVCAHPVSTSTEDMVRMCCEDIDRFLEVSGA
mgnify:CR=1 FL=1|jgi:hypothetical protein